MTSIDDLLSGGGAAGKGLKFEHVGQSYGGTVVSSEVRPYTDLKTGKPEYWDNDPNQPKHQIVIGIQTDQHDPSIENDDGVRYDYVKAWGVQKKALQAAAREAGGSPAVGDYYGVKFVKEEPSATRGFNPTKVYEYTVRKANPLDAALETQAAPAATQTYAATVPPAAPAAQQGPLADAAKIDSLIAMSLTDEQIEQALGVFAGDVAARRVQLVADGSSQGF